MAHMNSVKMAKIRIVPCILGIYLNRKKMIKLNIKIIFNELKTKIIDENFK
jgi:hypothetical protein